MRLLNLGRASNFTRARLKSADKLRAFQPTRTHQELSNNDQVPVGTSRALARRRRPHLAPQVVLRVVETHGHRVLPAPLADVRLLAPVVLVPVRRRALVQAVRRPAQTAGQPTTNPWNLEQTRVSV